MLKNYLLKSQFVPSKYPSLYGVRDSRDLILRLGLDNKLEVHTGCVSYKIFINSYRYINFINKKKKKDKYYKLE